MNKKNTLITLVMALMIALSGNTAIAAKTDCGTAKDKTLYVDNGKPSNAMDDKVQNCPSGYDWNACCNICGVYLQGNGTLSKGWSCSWATAGVWLRGCDKTGTCP